jgi:hypothetical protein
MKNKSCFLLLILMISCKNNNTGNPLYKNIELAKKTFNAFNEHNWVLQASFFSDTCKYLDPSYGNQHITVSQKDKVIKYSAMEQISPDIHDSIINIFGYGNKVVIQFTSTGTAKTEQGNYKWSVPICCIFTYKDSLIIVDETYYNKGK